MDGTGAATAGPPDAVVAAAAVYLAPEEVPFTHGAVLDVDAGRLGAAVVRPLTSRSVEVLEHHVETGLEVLGATGGLKDNDAALDAGKDRGGGLLRVHIRPDLPSRLHVLHPAP